MTSAEAIEGMKIMKRFGTVSAAIVMMSALLLGALGLNLMHVEVRISSVACACVPTPTPTPLPTPDPATLMPLPDALNDPSLNCVVSGDGEWFGQTALTHDGVGSAHSGFIGHSQSSTLTTWVEGPGGFSFWWRSSCEQYCDVATVYVDGGGYYSVTGETDWRQCFISLSPGVHEVKWTYSKDETASVGEDCAWVDEVMVTPYANPNAPSGLSAQADLRDPSHRVGLAWTDNDYEESWFTLERSLSPSEGFAAVATAGAHENAGVMSFNDPTTLSAGTTYYYRVSATRHDEWDWDYVSDYSNVTSVTLAQAPFFRETWDAVSDPYYPDESFLPDASGMVGGADQPGWQWSTLGSTATSCGFRSTGVGYEVGRFDAVDTGTFAVVAPIASMSFSQDRTLYSSFDLTVDSVGGSGQRYTMRLSSETDYNTAGGGALALWLDVSTATPSLGAQVIRQGTAGTTQTVWLAPFSGGPHHYRVYAGFNTTPSSTTLMQYQLLDQDNAGQVLAAGMREMDLVPGCALGRVECSLGAYAHGAFDNIVFSRLVANSDGPSSASQANGQNTSSMLTAESGGTTTNLAGQTTTVLSGQVVNPTQTAQSDGTALNQGLDTLGMDSPTDSMAPQNATFYRFAITPYSNDPEDGINTPPPMISMEPLSENYELNDRYLIVHKGSSVTFHGVEVLSDGSTKDPIHEGASCSWSASGADFDGPPWDESDYSIDDKSDPDHLTATITFNKTGWGAVQLSGGIVGVVSDSSDGVIIQVIEPASGSTEPNLTGEWHTTAHNTDGSIVGYITVTDITSPAGTNRIWGTNLTADPGTAPSFNSDSITLYPGIAVTDRYATLVLDGGYKFKRFKLFYNPYTPCQEILSEAPVNLKSGAKSEAENDVVIPNNGLDFVWSRHYNNQANHLGMLGHNWETNWSQCFMKAAAGTAANNDSEIVLTPSAYNKTLLDSVPGASVVPNQSLFHYNGFSTTEYAYASVGGNGFYLPPQGAYSTLKVATKQIEGSPVQVLKLYQSSGKIETYYAFNSPSCSTDGKLYSVEDQAGRRIILHYMNGYLWSFELHSSVNDTSPQYVQLDYWDDAADYANKKGLLKSFSYRGKEVVRYNYDDASAEHSSGDLTSVLLNGEHETRYKYYGAQSPTGMAEYDAAQADMRHNLVAVYRPREVAAAPSNPKPFKEIKYYTAGPNFNRVHSEFVGEYQDAANNGQFDSGSDDKISGTLHSYSYSQDPFPTSGTIDPAQAYARTVYRKGAGDTQEESEYQFNYLGLNIKTIRRGAPGGTPAGDLATVTGYDAQGRVTQVTDEQNRTGNSTFYTVKGFTDFCSSSALPTLYRTDSVKVKYTQFIQRFAGNVVSSNLDCQCSGAGTETLVTAYDYDPVTGQVRKKTVMPQGTHSPSDERLNQYYFDYQEAPYTIVDPNTLLTQLAMLMGISDAPAAEDRELVKALLTEFGIISDLNHSDLNGDGQQTAVASVKGLILQEQLPDATVKTIYNASHTLNSTSQSHVRKYQYNSEGNVSRYLNEAGNKTEYDYYYDRNSGLPTGSVYNAAVPDGSIAHVKLYPAATACSWTYTYDERGNLLSQTDPRGVKTEYQYNLHGQVVKCIRDSEATSNWLSGELFPYPAQPYQYVTNYLYDANGQLTCVEVEDRGPNQSGRNWIRTYYDYDILGQVTAIRQQPGGLSYQQAIGGVDKGSFYTTSFLYDELGRLALKVYPAGNADYMEYDHLGHLTQSTQGIAALTSTQQARIQGLPADMTAFTARLAKRNGTPLTTNYQYNTYGQLDHTSEGANGGDLYYRYDTQGRLLLRVQLMETSGANHTYQAESWEYDAFGNLKNSYVGSIPNPDSYNSTAPWHSMSVLRQANYVYDELDRVVQVNRKVIAPITTGGSNRLLGNDPASNWPYSDKPSSVESWLATRYEYDSLGRLTYATQDDGSYSHYTYDGVNQVTAVESYLSQPVGSPYLAGTVVYTYDAVGNLVETVQTDKSTLAGVDEKVSYTTRCYDSLGRLSKQIENAAHEDPVNGNGIAKATDYRYNSRDLLTAVADSNGANPTALFYRRRTPSASARWGHCNDYGNVQVFYYDTLGRKVMERQILTATGKGDGDHLGEPRTAGPSFILPRPDRSQGGGDGLIDTSYEYDPNGMLVALTDDNGNVTVWGYDSQNRLAIEFKGDRVDLFQSKKADVQKSGFSQTWTYDAHGNLSQLKREDDTLLTYSYYDSHRVSEINVTYATGTPAQVNGVGTTRQTFTYDVLGQLTGATDNNGPSGPMVTTSWSYDSLGRVYEEGQKIGSGPFRYVSRCYSSVQPSIIYYGSGQGYDLKCYGNNLLRSVSPAGSSTSIATYDYLGGRVLKRAMANGISLDMTDGTGAQYDELGRLAQVAHLSSSAYKVGFDYQYDPAGNVSQLRRLNGGRGTFADPQTFTYDSASRLKAASRSAAGSGLNTAFAWDLDGVGNWNSLSSSGGAPAARKVDSWNAALEAGTQKLTYDTPGNLTHDDASGDTMVWDAFGRLAQVYINPTPQTKVVIADYSYDALGRRARQVSANHYCDTLWNGWQAVEAYESDVYPTTSLKRSFVYGNGLDEPLLMHVVSGNIDYYYHQDALGSVVALSDSTGQILEAYEYDPYGACVVLTHGSGSSPVQFNATDARAYAGTSLKGNPYRFAGRTWDDTTKLYYCRHRYYDPLLGRFISPDPIGYGDGPNFYQYVYGNPLRFTDPLGLGGVAGNSDQDGIKDTNITGYMANVRANHTQGQNYLNWYESHVIYAIDVTGNYAALGKDVAKGLIPFPLTESEVVLVALASPEGRMLMRMGYDAALDGLRVASPYIRARMGQMAKYVGKGAKVAVSKLLGKEAAKVENAVVCDAGKAGAVAEEKAANALNVTRNGIIRKNAKDWRELRDLWDKSGYKDILSEANRAKIAEGRTPVVDSEWVKFFPEDAGLKGELIPMHHIQGGPITVPLPSTRHLDAHMPGGFRNNPGGAGGSLPIYPEK